MKVIKAEAIEKLLEQLEREIGEEVRQRDQLIKDKPEEWDREEMRHLGHACARIHVSRELRVILETAVSHWDIEEELVVEPPDPETEERDSDICARCGDPMDHDDHHIYCAGRSAYKLD